MLELSEIYKAAHALKGIIRHPLMIAAPLVNPESEVYLKPENLQFTGSFKLRGACYKYPSCRTKRNNAV